MPESDPDSAIPAQLSFLAIYNPTLGPTDETIEDQIVFYTSRSKQLQRTDSSAAEEEGSKLPEDGKNERLRQIGLAQGMVSFASNFSPDKSLEYVETEKARIVLLELEKDWWIVASIDFTRLPAEAPSSDNSVLPSFQYSSREMGPPHLLIQQLRRAHSIFLLLHDFSLGDLYSRVGRLSFCIFLDRFWEKFAWNWELLLTGSPIVDIYNGIKLAAGGELGIGVGEEEWGSGEREVLEDFVTRTDGLLDLVVSRFGDPSLQAGTSASMANSSGEDAWLGSDTDPRPADGVIFSGVNALSRSSLVHVSHWMEWIYRYGDAAYGVGRDPSSLRRRKPRRHRGRQLSGTKNSKERHSSAQPSTPERSHTPGIPRPLVMAAPQAIPETQENTLERSAESSAPGSDQKTGMSAFGTEAVMKYLTLGYGSSWSLSTKSTSSPPPEVSPAEPGRSSTAEQITDTTQYPPTNRSQSGVNTTQHKTPPSGRFVLGPRDDLDRLDDLEEESPVPESDTHKIKTRIVHRTLHVHMADTSDNNGDLKKLQAVIYVHQPFMFTFLFEPDTPSLSSPSLYSSIHHQLGPLQKPLLSSTSPTTAASRIAMSDNTGDPSKRFSSRAQPLYDLVYDPSTLTIRSSIPNIPSLNPPSAQPENHNPPRTPSSSPSQLATKPPLSRVESLAIHHRLLTTYTDSRTRPQELERTCKTTRGWWIVWVRLPQPTPPSPTPPALSSTSSSAALSSMTEEPRSPTRPSPSPPPPQAQEAFLVRKASDYAPPASNARISSGARFFRDLGGASSSKLGPARGADTTPSKLVEGFGVDARRYVEGLLRLNR